MASANALSNYSAVATPSYSYKPVMDRSEPKFSQYRSQVMLGDLPGDFLRIKLNEPIISSPEVYQMQGGYHHGQNPNFLGFLTLTIAEGKFAKGASLLGLVKIDPYVSFRIGHVHYETPTAAGGGKNPQWKCSYRLNLFKGMDKIFFEVFDQRSFTEDAFIGECEVAIPSEVMEGQTRQNWYPLFGKGNRENQGDLLIIMSFLPTGVHPQTVASANSAMNAHPDRSANVGMATGNSTAVPSSPTHLHSPSAIPKPPPPPYSQEDVQTIQEMFPTTDRRFIIDLFDKNGGNKDLVVNYLLQNAT